MANAFVAFGIDPRSRPRRFLTRRVTLAFGAEVVWRYDIEMGPVEERQRINVAYWGAGTERPAKPIPFRVRERQVEET